MKEKKKFGGFTSKRIISLVLAGIMVFSSFALTAFGENNPNSFLPDPVVLYDFDQTSGTQVLDKSGNDFHGTLIGGAAWDDDGVNGHSVKLSASADYISLPKEVLQTLNDVSVSITLYLDKNDTWTTVFMAGRNDNNFAMIAANGRPSGNPVGWTLASRIGGAAEQRISEKDKNNLPIKEWVNIVYTQEASTNNAKMYMNGNLVGESTAMSYLFKDLYHNDAKVYLGKNVAFNDPNVTGKFGGFAMYDRILTAAEVKSDYENSFAGKDAKDIDIGGPDIFSNITLPTSINNSTITWQSSDTSVISNTGVVTRSTESDKQVTLTATVTKGTTSVTRDFVLNVKQMSDVLDVDTAADALSLPTAVRADISLPLAGILDTSIFWETNNAAFLTSAGVVTRPAKGEPNKTVTLTATITKGEITKTVTKDVIVISLDDLVHHYTFENDASDSISGSDGTLIQSAKIENGVLVLNGAGDYLEMPTGWVKDAESLSVSMWIKSARKTFWESLFQVASGQNEFLSFDLAGQPSGGVSGPIWKGKLNSSAEEQLPTSTSLAPQTGEWSHVAATFNNGIATIYVNGVEVAKNTTAFRHKKISDFGNTPFNFIGKSVWPDPTFGGSMSDYKIHYRDLSSAEMLSEYEDGLLEMAYKTLDIGNTDNVFENIKLPSSSIKGTSISWESSNTEFLSNAGIVNLPSAEQGNQTVTLTATISKDGSAATKNKTFTVTLPAMTDETIADMDADYVTRYVDYLLNDGVTLLSAGKHGSSVAWELTSGDAKIEGGKLLKTATSAEREPIKLKATITKNDIQKEVDFENVVLMDKYVAHLMSYFKQEPNGMCLNYSFDGINWEMLNNADTVVQATEGTTWVRDPFLLRNKEGDFTVIATQGWDTPSVYLWDSYDLTGYTNPRLVKVAEAGTVGLTGARAWAPEASYDPIKDIYYMYWSDPYARNNLGATFYNSSKDMKTFSGPDVYFDPNLQMIDAALIKHDGEYFMAFKGEDSSSKSIMMARSKSLDPGSFTRYTGEITDRDVEGPFIFKSLTEEKWFLYYDYFTLGGSNTNRFGYSVTDDLSSGEWTTMGRTANLPAVSTQHGGVTPVTLKELERIRTKWNPDEDRSFYDLQLLIEMALEKEESDYTEDSFGLFSAELIIAQGITEGSAPAAITSAYKNLYNAMKNLETSAAAEGHHSYVDMVNKLVDMETIATIPQEGESAGEFTSFDRSSTYDEATDTYSNWGANDDGVGVVEHLGYVPGKGNCDLIADIKGPGAIWRIWSATTNAGLIEIYIDGEPVPTISKSFRDLFTGSDSMFGYDQLSYTAAQGKNCLVPITYNESCKIYVYGDWGKYYEINYSTLPEGSTVEPMPKVFSAEDREALTNVNNFFKNNLNKNPNDLTGAVTATNDYTVKPNEKKEVLNATGSGALAQFKVKVNEDLNYNDMWDALKELTVSMYWDGETSPSVWAPLGDFFGTPSGPSAYSTLPMGLGNDGWFYCYFYMPFGNGAKITIGNDGKVERNISVDTSIVPLTKPIETYTRFHAKWNKDANQPEREDRWPDYTILKTEGAGRFVGTSLHVYKSDNLEDPDAGEGFFWWGEGDEKFFVDGEKFPSSFGTGTEDYFGYAWCDPTVFNNRPYHAQNYTEGGVHNKGNRANLRYHVADSIPFSTEFEGNIEQYYRNNTEYSVVSYWYLTPDGVDNYTPVSLDKRTSYYVQQPLPSLIFEGEDMPREVEGGRGENQLMAEFSDFGWSNRRHLLWIGNNDGDKINLDFNITSSIKGELKVNLTKAGDFGMFDFYLDGEPIGNKIDTYNPKVINGANIPLGYVDLSPGVHTLTVVANGKNPASPAYIMGLDCIRIDPTPTAKNVVEGEDMEVLYASAGNPMLQDMSIEFPNAGTYSKGKQMWWAPARNTGASTNQGQGDKLKLALDLKNDVNGEMFMAFTKANDYGLFRISLDGNVIGQDVDLFDNNVVRSDLISFGDVSLTAGRHELEIEIIGRNAASKGFLFALDNVFFKTTDETSIVIDETTFVSDGNLKATANILNDTENEKSVKIIIAQYSADGKLEEYSEKVETVPSGVSTITLEHQLPSDISGKKVKAFAWDGTTLAPLCASAEVN